MPSLRMQEELRDALEMAIERDWSDRKLIVYLIATILSFMTRDSGWSFTNG